MDSFQGTPDTRLTMFSPGESSVTYHHGGHGNVSYTTGPLPPYDAFAPHGSITGDRIVSTFDRDPFVDTSNTGRLSPTAASFQPVAQRNKGKTAAVLLPEGGVVVANALSHEMGISHRLEVCDTPTPAPEEVKRFMDVSITADCSVSFILTQH
jgi:hypothetical protein